MKVSGQIHVPSASPTCRNPGTSWRLGRLQSRSGQFEVENKSVARAGIGNPDHSVDSQFAVPNALVRSLPGSFDVS